MQQAEWKQTCSKVVPVQYPEEEERGRGRLQSPQGVDPGAFSQTAATPRTGAIKHRQQSACDLSMKFTFKGDADRSVLVSRGEVLPSIDYSTVQHHCNSSCF